jgi:hypothetical protein
VAAGDWARQGIENSNSNNSRGRIGRWGLKQQKPGFQRGFQPGFQRGFQPGRKKLRIS